MEQIPVQKKGDWGDYYEKTKANPPSRLLREALEHAEQRGHALELGAGTPTNALFLAEAGYEVTAIDADEASEKHFAGIEDEHVAFSRSRFEDLDLVPESYDLISAQRALPFISERSAFDSFITSIVAALRPRGIFVAHFFGPDDTWAKEGRGMTFVTREEIESLLEGMEIISINEHQEDRPTVAGTPHHWHIIEVIAKKTS